MKFFKLLSIIFLLFFITGCFEDKPIYLPDKDIFDDKAELKLEIKDREKLFNQAKKELKNKNFEEAKDLFEESCEMGNLEACIFYSKLSKDNELKMKITKNLLLFQKAKSIIKKDKEKAKDLLDESCDNGIKEACLMLKNIELKEILQKRIKLNFAFTMHKNVIDKDFQKLKESIKYSCDVGNKEDCSLLKQLQQEIKQLHKKQKKERLEFIAKNKKIALKDLKNLNFEEAENLLEKTCKVGDGESCYLLAQTPKYEFGWFKALDIKDLYDKSCEYGYKKGCEGNTNVNGFKWFFALLLDYFLRYSSFLVVFSVYILLPLYAIFTESNNVLQDLFIFLLIVTIIILFLSLIIYLS